MIHKSLIEKAVADSGAVEVDTISKNGRILKSLMSRGNIFLVITALVVIMFSMVACGSGSGKIPNGTYVQVGGGENYFIFSGNKVKTTYWYNSIDFVIEGTYMISGDKIIVTTNSGSVYDYKYAQDGKKFVLPDVGRVFERK